MAIFDSIADQLGIATDTGFTADAPEVSIEQVSDSNPRRISLRGRALPRSGFELEGEQRTSTTYYPGNPSATMQVLGTTWGSTTLTGEWKFRFIGDPNVESFQLEGFPEIDIANQKHPRELVRAFDLLRDEGKPVIVTWDEWQRKGILRRFKASWPRPQEVEWEAEFEWQNLGDEWNFAIPVDLPGSDVLSASIGLDDVFALDPYFILPDYNALLTSKIAGIREKVGVVFDAIRYASNQLSTPATALQALTSAIDSIIVEARSVAQQTVDRPYIYASPRDGVVDVLAASNWERTVNRDTAILVASAQRTERDFAEEQAPGALEVVLVPADTTLRALSTAYYGDPDDWQLIADVNGLVDSVVPAGTAVIIPAKPQPRSRTRAVYTTEDAP